MEQELRNSLRQTVGALRTQLITATEQQLEGVYGILSPDGRVLPIEDVPPLRDSPELQRRRAELLEAIDHERQQATGSGRQKRGLQLFILKSAFTQLNRLAALKVLERRKLIPETIASGTSSRGFQLFKQVEPALGQIDGGYQVFLESVFDDVASEIRLVFDRSLPASHLFPTGSQLESALELLNDEAIAAAWDEDEVLGWVYQYFTPKELREKVRKESSAPRNTYELAIRNQFYTPDYVVRFLAENSLGRLWWEMNPSTSIKDRDLLVYRHDEKPPERSPKDPREIRVLDPACGSGHFLHYCFDLLGTIYLEAFDGHEAGAALRDEFETVDDLERAIPSLILRHNLFGIDIDLRAAQLTALSLYLRAKRSHPEAQIRKVNAIHAAPMPGNAELFEDFLASLDPDPNAELLRALLRDVWQEIGDLAAEAGTLLRAERSIRKRIEELKAEVASASARQLGMVELLGPEIAQGELKIDAIPTETFWENLESRALQLLAAYAESAEGHGIARRLFAEDAYHGMAFVDALLQKYDVVLMNPPFGKASKPSKKYIDKSYPRTKNDVYAAFVERGLELLHPKGYLGAITSRTGFFLTSFQKWREEILLKETDVVTFADLGAGVLDTAMVETAAYVLRKTA